MFAVFGKTRAEEEARRGLVHDKQKGIWYEDSAPARLTLVNTVNNVLSGTAQAEDFPLSADGRILVDGRMYYKAF